MILLVLFSGFFLRLILAGFGTLSLDMGTFVAWSQKLVSLPLNEFYNSWSDYLPGYLYVLWFLGILKNNLGFLPEVLLFKVPSILADLATGFLIYRILKDFKGEKWGLIGVSLYLFNPAILGNSTFWGQVDSLTAFFSLLSIYLVEINPVFSAISLAVGGAIKPQAALAAPVILFVILQEKWNFKKIFSYIFLSLGIFLLLFVPFQNKNNFASFVLERLSTTNNQYPYGSVNAFNFWGLFGFWQKDNLVFQLGGVLLVGVVSLISGIKLFKKKDSRYLFAAVIFSTSFLFMTRLHERHLLPALAPVLIASASIPALLISYVGFSLTYIANLFYSFNWITYDFKSVFPELAIKLLILSNLFFLAVILSGVFRPEKLKEFLASMAQFIDTKRWKSRDDGPMFTPVLLGRHTVKALLLGIIIFSAVSRLLWLGNPSKEYFDEVYHAFTAKLVLHGDPKAWEWWNPHPEGFAYEWTHPPLAKLGMALSMRIFGENSFGWRLPGALLGVGSVFLVYLLARELFKDELVGILSAAVFSLDGLPLVMSRIGMNDSYLLFFSLLTLYLFLKEKYLFSALSFGLAASSKWSAIWLISVLFVFFFVRKKTFKKGLLWFLILPPLVYLASYFQMFLTGHGLDIFWGMQKQMWWYHTNLKATHAYTSSWWSWPMNLRPIYLYTSDEINGWVSRIYAIGNPAVFWFGIVSIIATFISAIVYKSKKLGLIIFSYLVFFVPWAASPRIMFLYHYLPSIPFLAIASGYVLRRFPKIIFAYLFICLLVFIYFYPHWAGLNIPLWLDKSYYWFASWR